MREALLALPLPRRDTQSPKTGDLTSHVLLCKKAPSLPLARLPWGEYHWFVLIGLVPA
jgi:hypothetical protein